MKSIRIFNRGGLARILFYGLFLLGPYILTESHSLHVKAKCECLKTENAVIRERAQNEYKRKVRFLDCLGVSCFGVWSVWLMVLVFAKLIQFHANKRGLSGSKDSMPSENAEGEYPI